MCETGLDLEAAGPSGSGLAHDRHEVVAALDDLLRLNAEAVKALEPAAQEALEAVASAMRTGVGARSGFVLLDVRIEQLQHDRQITTIERLVAAFECLDVRARHSRSVHQVQGPASE